MNIQPGQKVVQLTGEGTVRIRVVNYTTFYNFSIVAADDAIESCQNIGSWRKYEPPITERLVQIAEHIEACKKEQWELYKTLPEIRL